MREAEQRRREEARDRLVRERAAAVKRHNKRLRVRKSSRRNSVQQRWRLPSANEKSKPDWKTNSASMRSASTVQHLSSGQSPACNGSYRPKQLGRAGSAMSTSPLMSRTSKPISGGRVPFAEVRRSVCAAQARRRRPQDHRRSEDHDRAVGTQDQGTCGTSRKVRVGSSPHRRVPAQGTR